MDIYGLCHQLLPPFLQYQFPGFLSGPLLPLLWVAGQKARSPGHGCWCKDGPPDDREHQQLQCTPSTCPGRTHLRPAVRHCVSDEEQDQHRRETREVESKELQAGDILHSASLAVGLLTPGSFALLTNMHGISTHLTSNGSYDSSQCVA